MIVKVARVCLVDRSYRLPPIIRLIEDSKSFCLLSYRGTSNKRLKLPIFN